MGGSKENVGPYIGVCQAPDFIPADLFDQNADEIRCCFFLQIYCLSI